MSIVGKQFDLNGSLNNALTKIFSLPLQHEKTHAGTIIKHFPITTSSNLHSTYLSLLSICYVPVDILTKQPSK